MIEKAVDWSSLEFMQLNKGFVGMRKTSIRANLFRISFLRDGQQGSELPDKLESAGSCGD